MESLPLLQDIPRRSTFFAVTIRSPVPRGRLLSIEGPEMERSYTLITAKDIPGKNQLAGFPVPVLASGAVSYLGEPVALLTGPDRAKLEAYAERCRVMVREERPVFAAPASAENPGPAPAEDPGPPAEAKGTAGNADNVDDTGDADNAGDAGQPPSGAAGGGAAEAAGAEHGPPGNAETPAPPPDGPSGAPAEPAPPPDGPPSGSPAEPEILLERSLSRGDIDAAFAAPARVLGAVYTTGIQEHCYAEPVGALAEYISGGSGKDGEGDARLILVIHTGAQWPGHVSRSAAAVLGLEESQVITEAADPGLPMDGKIWYPSLIACQAALAACLTRRNVRLLLTREEDFRFSPKRNASVIKIDSALGEKGEILGTSIDLTVDLGAQVVFGEEILDQSCLGVLGIAGRGALSLKARALKTNIPPQGPFAGFGAAQGAFAMERHSSLIADSLGLDPAEWRKGSYPRRKDLPVPAGAAPIERLLDAAAAMADYYRKWGSYELLRRRRREDSPPARPENLRGIGIALGRQGSGFLHIDESPFSVEVTLNIDGSLEIRTSVKAGEDFTRIWAGIARETLGVEGEKVRIISRNTALCPDSGPESLSRNIGSVTPLVERGCQAIRNQRFRDPLPITVRETPGGEADPLARCPGLPFNVPNPGSQEHPGWAAAVVEAEFEPRSYSPVIRGVWLAADGGKILSESRARRGLKLAGIQALGWASGEWLEYRGGAVTPSGFTAYGLPNPGEIPPIRVDFLRDAGAAPKGIGDLPFSCIPAAYIQAVSQALDYPFTKIPLRPADIWEALGSKAGEKNQGGPA
jgi:CO/xanthine dehydrogenase Mo-binding subunit